MGWGINQGWKNGVAGRGGRGRQGWSSLKQIPNLFDIYGDNVYLLNDPSDLELSNGNPVVTFPSTGVYTKSWDFGVGNQPTFDTVSYPFPVISSNGVTDFGEIASSTGDFKFLHNGQALVIALFSVVDANPDAIHPILSTGAFGSADIGYGLFYDDRSSAGRDNAIIINIAKGTFGDIFSQNLRNNFFNTQQINILYNILDSSVSITNRNKLSLNFGTTFYGTSGSSSPPSSGNSTGNITLFKDPTSDIYAKIDLAYLAVIKDVIPTAQQLNLTDQFLVNKFGNFPIT